MSDRAANRRRRARRRSGRRVRRTQRRARDGGGAGVGRATPAVVAASLIRVYGEWSFLRRGAGDRRRRPRPVVPAAPDAAARRRRVACCRSSVRGAAVRVDGAPRDVRRDLPDRIVHRRRDRATCASSARSSPRRSRRWPTNPAGPRSASSAWARWCGWPTPSRSRPEGRGEALVPGAVLFVFVAALGTDRLRDRTHRCPDRRRGRRRGGTAGQLRGAAAHQPGSASSARGRARFPPRWSWPASSPCRPGRSGPRLPGAEAEPWVDTRGQGGGGVTEVVSPLVDIRARLVDQSDTEMMVVTASADANWRVSTLAQFDGRTWGLPPAVACPARAASSTTPVRTAPATIRQYPDRRAGRAAGARRRRSGAGRGRGAALQRGQLDARAHGPRPAAR